MNILVCISNVPDTTSAIEFSSEGTSFESNGIQFIINPYDEFGLTKAIKLREKHGGTVTVAHVGLATSDPTLRKSLAIGADKAIRVDLEAKDSFSVAKELANVIEQNSFDLIICGRESIDYNGGAVPAMLSEFLNLPFINACTFLECNDSEVNMEREIEGGKEVIQSKLPLIIAGQKGLVEESDLLIPNMRGIMTARSKPLEVCQAISNTQQTFSVNFEKPAPKQDCKMIEAGNEDELINLLHQEAKVI
jgi:electron transfer flavoprotein beta subunit